MTNEYIGYNVYVRIMLFVYYDIILDNCNNDYIIIIIISQ